MANFITLMRLPVLLILVLTLYAPSPQVRVAGVFLVVLLIAMDSLDGIVARRRNEVSLMGSVLDIMMDRSVELVLWVAFAHRGVIPVAIPIIAVLRGTMVDSLRSLHISSGVAPFGSARSGLSKWLVGSPVMRTSYGVAKLLSFTGLATVNALALYAVSPSPAHVTPELVHRLGTVFVALSWVAIAFCIARGLPVIIESFGTIAGREKNSHSAS